MPVDWEFQWKGRWVLDVNPSIYFWAIDFHKSNLPKYLLWKALYGPLLWACLRLSGDARVPYEYQDLGALGSKTIGRWTLDMPGALYAIFWFKNPSVGRLLRRSFDYGKQPR